MSDIIKSHAAISLPIRDFVFLQTVVRTGHYYESVRSACRGLIIFFLSAVYATDFESCTSPISKTQDLCMRATPSLPRGDCLIARPARRLEFVAGRRDAVILVARCECIGSSYFADVFEKKIMERIQLAASRRPTALPP